jgi:hypothetical protein
MPLTEGIGGQSRPKDRQSDFIDNSTVHTKEWVKASPTREEYSF